MTSMSKKICIDELDDIINEYNNTYHRTIKMKPINVKDKKYFDFDKENNDKHPKFNFKLVIMWEDQNTKITKQTTTKRKWHKRTHTQKHFC